MDSQIAKDPVAVPTRLAKLELPTYYVPDTGPGVFHMKIDQQPADITQREGSLLASFLNGLPKIFFFFPARVKSVPYS